MLKELFSKVGAKVNSEQGMFEGTFYEVSGTPEQLREIAVEIEARGFHCDNGLAGGSGMFVGVPLKGKQIKRLFVCDFEDPGFLCVY